MGNVQAASLSGRKQSEPAPATHLAQSRSQGICAMQLRVCESTDQTITAAGVSLPDGQVYSSLMGPMPSIQSLKKFTTCTLLSLLASRAKTTLLVAGVSSPEMNLSS